MRVLLDTHTWIWLLADEDRLPKRWRVEFALPSCTLLVSSISHWELCCLIARGRVSGRYENIKVASDQLDIHEVPLTSSVAVLGAQIALDHRDPADRFIAASAILADAKLATMDQRLLDSPLVPTLDAADPRPE